MSNLRYKCLELHQAKSTFYLFSAKAKTLYNILDINRRNPDKDEGYQRVLSPSRVNSMTKFINDGQVLAPSLLISLDNAKYDKKAGVLVIPRSKSAGWVIDGQHRLAGTSRADEDIDLAVVAFLGLDEEEQIFQFVTINREGKGVPTSLYYDLLAHLPKGKSPGEIAKEKAVAISEVLKKDEESPFLGRITIGSPMIGREISLTNFVRKISPLVNPEKGQLRIYSSLEQTMIIDNYFKGLKVAEPNLFTLRPSIAFKTIGFGALINAFPTIFSVSTTHFNSFTVANVAEIFNKAKFDFSTWEEFGTGNAAEVMAGKDLEALATQAFTVDDSSNGLIKLV